MSSRNVLLLWLCILLSLSIVDTPLQAQEFERASDACNHAHAILGWSDFSKAPDETDEAFEERIKRPWTKMGWIVGRLNWGRQQGSEALAMVDSYEAGKVGQAEFKEYGVKGHPNGKAYVAHCGHGGTCNMLAARLFRNYKGIGKPRVYCGQNALPKVLESPSRPSIPIPTDEELAQAEEDDDDFDFGDDDDDDKDKKKKDKPKEPSVDDF